MNIKKQPLHMQDNLLFKRAIVITNTGSITSGNTRYSNKCFCISLGDGLRSVGHYAHNIEYLMWLFGDTTIDKDFVLDQDDLAHPFKYFLNQFKDVRIRIYSDNTKNGQRIVNINHYIEVGTGYKIINILKCSNPHFECITAFVDIPDPQRYVATISPQPVLNHTLRPKQHDFEQSHLEQEQRQLDFERRQLVQRKLELEQRKLELDKRQLELDRKKLGLDKNQSSLVNTRSTFDYQSSDRELAQQLDNYFKMDEHQIQSDHKLAMQLGVQPEPSIWDDVLVDRPNYFVREF